MDVSDRVNRALEDRLAGAGIAVDRDFTRNNANDESKSK